MKLWAAGQDTVTFSASMAQEVMTRPTFIKARDELVESGFISYINQPTAKHKKETGQYEFSSRWLIKKGLTHHHPTIESI